MSDDGSFCRPFSVIYSPMPARPGGDRLSRALGRSTIGAEGFHGRVRDGIGCWPLARATRPCRDRRTSYQLSAIGFQLFC